MIPANGFETPLKPILVEVSSRGYTIHPTRQSFPAIEEKTPEVGPQQQSLDPNLKRFLHEVERKKNREYLVFLIHPNGIQAFESLRNYLRSNHDEIRIGWEPFSTNWIVAADESGTALGSAP